MADSWDLVVIGGGSGGLACAQRAAEHGARVALAEPGLIGGTCVNAGCVPKKIMVHAAELAHGIHDAADYGFDLELRGHDWRLLKERRDAYVRKLHGVYLENLARRNVTLMRDRAYLAWPGKVAIGNREQQVKEVVIATGGQPIVPAVPGAELGITSDGFFALERMPASVAIVGSGYVAAELSGVFAALGARVTLLMRHDRILRSFDEMLSRRLMTAMQADGMELAAQAIPAALEQDAAGRWVVLDDGRRAGPYGCVVWAIGRKPVTEGLGLEGAGVAIGGAGEIVTDLRQDTNVKHIHAVGDVTGRAPLTPVAIAAGRRLADRLYGGVPDRHLDYRHIPTVIFSHPPIGTIGPTEVEARAQFGERVSVFQGDFMPLYHGITERRRRAEIKLVTVGPERRIVGLHAIGMGVDEMLQGFAVAIRMGATKQDFDDTVAIHPTTAEEAVTLRG